MPLLEPREGRTQLQVLSAIAYLEEEKEINPRVKDITDTVILSKGAVSNNCKKLLDQGFITERDNRFQLDKERLFAAYREHFESYLIRETNSQLFGDEVKQNNQARTHTKKNLHGWLKNQTFKKMIVEIVFQSLLSVREQSRLKTLREVFFYADHLVRKTHEEIEEEMWEGKQKGSGGKIREAFDYLARCLDVGTSRLDPVFETMSKGTPIFENGELRKEIRDQLKTFCEENQIKKLSLFGSGVHKKFTPLSDIDVVVEFKEGEKPGWDIVTIEQDLEDIFQRKVDLLTDAGISSKFRKRAMKKAKVLYEAA